MNSSSLKNEAKPKTKLPTIKWLLALLVILPILYFVLPGMTSKLKVGLARFLTTDSSLKRYELPGKTNWEPSGLRKISSNKNINSRPVSFARAMHTDIHGSDEVATVIAPAFEFDWNAEPNYFTPEGPVFDRDGNVYFCPVFPPDNVIMISIEPENGTRRWVLEGFSAGCGTPLILQDDQNGEDIVYIGTYDRLVAAKTDGTIIWDVPTGLQKMDPSTLKANQHNFGVNYHAQTDSLIASLGDGHVYVIDRKTGKPLLNEIFVMPGDKLPSTNFSLPEGIASKANEQIAHMVGKARNVDPIVSVLNAAAGELQRVTNFFSIDTNSGRIWIASTLPDEEDGTKDGWSEIAALYGLDLVKKGNLYDLEIKIVARVPGGTASTPAISADGGRVYIADAFNTVYAIDAVSGERIWSLDVESKVAGSINVSADNGELYVNTRTRIKKVFDRGDYAELGWTANLNMYETGFLQENIKSLGAEIAANGIAFTGAAGVVAGKQKFPLQLGAGIIDKETGEIRYFAGGAEDSVSSMVIAPDGGLYIGNSPMRRVLGRVILGESRSPQPVIGGITKFKPIHQNLTIRDALWAAANRAKNAAQFAETNVDVVEVDIFNIRQLLNQCEIVAPGAIEEGAMSQENWDTIKIMVDQVDRSLYVSNTSLIEAHDLLKQAVGLVE
jgi:outer membrane protein assembly factor BamB